MPPSPILDYLESLRTRLRDLNGGNVADYIPELARVDPDRFGICIATRDGFVYEVGDSRQPFTIQSVSKPLTYGLALEDNGEAAVLAKIGVEPSGDAFNAISLRPQTGAPLNPLINAGAIAACGLVRRRHGRSRDRAHHRRVFALRRPHARRRRSGLRGPRARPDTAIARSRWMLRNFSIFDGRSDADARDLLPAVLDPRHLPRPRADRCDARQRRRESGHRDPRHRRRSTWTTSSR